MRFIRFVVLLAGIAAWAVSQAAAQGPCSPGWKFGLDQGIPGIGMAGGGGHAVTAWDPDGPGPTPEWLIIGGGFVSPAAAGNIRANNIAAWDGQAWHNLGGGVQGQVLDLIVFNGDLIAAGSLWEAGGVPVNGIARYDGTAWHAMDTGLTGPGGVPGTVYALAVFQGRLVAAGSFTSGSGLLTSNIAAWNGAAWEGLGFGIDGQQVRALAVLGDDLYAGGHFHTAGAVGANNIARWNGAWSALGDGTGSDVYALAPRANGTLAVGGGFLQAGGIPADRLAVWAPMGGGGWQNPFSAGVLGGVVLGIREVGSHLLIAGTFAPSLYMQGIISWNLGSGFRPLGFGTDAAVRDIGMWDGKPVIVGGFSSVGPVDVLGQPTVAWGVAIFDSTLCPEPGCHIIGGWRRLTPGIDGEINALGVSGGDLFIGGYPLNSAGMLNPVAMASRSGEAWGVMVGQVPPPPGSQIPGRAHGPAFYPWQAVVNAIVDYQGWTIAAGQFNDPAFLSRNITSWTGDLSYWGAVFFDPINGSQDLDAMVRALATWDPDGPGPNIPLMLIAGGDFTTAGRGGTAVAASRIAGFKSGYWEAFGAGVNGRVAALAVHNGDLIVGGSFTEAGGALASSIARLHLDPGGPGQPAAWVWSPLGTGIDGSVLALKSHNGALYAGGRFSIAGGVAAANIARWDGESWHALGDGLGQPSANEVRSLAGYRGDLYAGGSFQGSLPPGGGGILMANIGRWDGQAWHPLDGGVNGPVLSLVEYQGRLMVGGQFTEADGQVSHRLARWGPEIIAPVISQGAFPPGASPVCGQDVGFEVTVAYGTSPGFRWRRNGVPLQDGPTGTGSAIENSSTARLVIRNVSVADNAVYDCVVSNSCGSATSGPATLSVCYANCDCSTGQPALNVSDFICFINKFAAQDPFANCDGSTTPPVLNVSDFTCFLNAFGSGCP